MRAIPASAPFLDTLAEAMIAALSRKNDPFALSDALVLLPNRRSARGLIDAFARRLGGAALLPTIRPLGDPQADDDPDVWGADPIAEQMPPPIDRTRRRLQLAALIRRRGKAENGVDDPARALALADELARLLDSAATVDRVAWEKLPTLVEEIDLAKHWVRSADFLSIIATYWPQHLAEQGVSDPAAHGAALRRALAARWRATPPRHPVVIAGSTGSQSTTRDLMRVAMNLPLGVVVLPGVDVAMDDESWDAIGDQHPQFALKGTLSALGLARTAIPSLAAERASGEARQALLREALAPAEKTADWLSRLSAGGGADFFRNGMNGIRLVEAETEDEEATAIALMLREALEQTTSTAAVVTPDAALAKRIESKLARWGVTPAVSHGQRLGETEAGRLIVLLCELAIDHTEPVALAALLKHSRVKVSGDRHALAGLEHEALRGPRRFSSWAELKGLTKSPMTRLSVERVEAAMHPLAAAMACVEMDFTRFADALAECAEALTDGDVWRGRDGELAAQLLREAIEHGAQIGPMTSYAAPRVLMRLMDGREVAPASRDERIAIWGLLEARLQRRDLMILAGLNEGVWPSPPGEDPFLSRAMREALGVPSLDQRIGLAAHDFAQLASAPNVVLSRALRKDGAPALASRWLWRLKTLVQGAGATLESAAPYVAWARALHTPTASTTTKPPKPCPPGDKRLKRISVTSVETLIRDPYAVYARRILQLDHLKPIGASAGAAERGTAVHAAIERFGDGDDPELLLRLMDEELARAGVSAERRAAEQARLRATVGALIAWFAERRASGVEVFREVRGAVALGAVTLTGVADRIEVGRGYAAVADFKTGKPPSDRQVETGLSPQLLLEAEMLARGAFEGVPKESVDDLLYWHIGGADPAPRLVKLEEPVSAAAAKAMEALEALLSRYARADQPFLSKPRVQFIKPFAEYDHLARRKEWADADGGDA
ncbi:MAG: PD-(D/E)XK nuclease family protein [Hyphomonadaceae bacterium]|nr:PD-(D/E)XK nuclease family protein [Hyphomonadaceae bacterium]